jgi:parallel beta-helix repeat protein
MLYSITAFAQPESSAHTPPSHPVCDLPSPIAGKQELNSACVYRGRVLIQTSNTELDCKGATIDASGLSGDALVIKGRGLRDIKVQDCIVLNSEGNGIRVGSDLRPRDLDRLFPQAARYEAVPRNILIKDIIVKDAERSGIYLNAYVHDVAISNVRVEGAGGVAIYLDQSTRNITIEESVFRQNGFGTERAPRKKASYREGLAIDSSAQNTIRRNYFEGNAAGGIFLYKNCHERASTKPDSVPRWQSAGDNLIEENRFFDEPVGIWVASRQSRNLSAWDCGDTPYAKGFYLDSAKGNRIIRNDFVNVRKGLLIEDDETLMLENTVSANSSCIDIGTKQRSLILHAPVIGSSLIRNRCTLKSGEGYVFKYGATHSKFEGNLSNGKPASPSLIDSNQ